MAGKICDHKSVGVIVKNKRGQILLIERAQFPEGFAPPSGHIDSHGTPRQAARNELKEEVGLDAEIKHFRQIYHGIVKNRCRRKGGTWHRWWVFEAKTWQGKVRLQKAEAKGFRWTGPRTIARFIAAHRLDPAWENLFEKW